MRRTRSHWLVVLMLVSTLALAGVAAAADTGSSPVRSSPHAGRFQQALGLTDDQMNSIRQLFAQHAVERKQLSESLRHAQSELRRLALTGGDPAAIEAKRAEVVKLLGQQVAMRVESLQAIAPILTPDQRAKLAEIVRHGVHWHLQQGS
jgi:Spy/CpxP family protein refolding chaperone